MSTRSTTHFCWRGESAAIVYRHADSYPEGHGVDLHEFLQDIRENLEDTRFDDPTYLAAKLVVWLADKFRYHWERGEGRFEKVKSRHLLDFLSVSVVLADPDDIDYRYEIECRGVPEGARPPVRCYRMRFQRQGPPEKGEECPLPPPPTGEGDTDQ